MDTIPIASQIPQAPCVLTDDGTCWQWVVADCPYCQGQHVHGAGQLQANSRKRLDVRAAHCKMRPDVVYQLVEKEEPGSTLTAPIRSPIYSVKRNPCRCSRSGASCRCSVLSARAFVDAALEVEGNGGMLVPDGSRRRTVGRIFFHLVRQEGTEEERLAIFPPWKAKKPPAKVAEHLNGEGPKPKRISSLWLDLANGSSPGAGLGRSRTRG
jgi:hypothetical protein